MKRRYSLITVSKGRLDHLKQTLPLMLEQGADEVIVVDYSCPEGTAAYVNEHFPPVRVVKVEGEEYFSNWKGRNAGAAVASGDVLVFCDADTILDKGAIEWIDENLPDRSYGYFKLAATGGFNRNRERLAVNQLKGFHVIPRATFQQVEGYDELFEGYAAGADTDLEDRLIFIGLKKFMLDPEIVESVIEHETAERIAHHRDPIPLSYGTGLIYRHAKFAALKIRRVPELPLEARRAIHASATEAARKLRDGAKQVGTKVTLREETVGMPRQLGFERASIKLSLVVEVTGEVRADEAAE